MRGTTCGLSHDQLVFRNVVVVAEQLAESAGFEAVASVVQNDDALGAFEFSLTVRNGFLDDLDYDAHIANTPD